MFPWTLQRRLQLAILLPASLLFSLLALLALLEYRQDLERQFRQITQFTVDNTLNSLSYIDQSHNDLDHWLQSRLRHESLRRLSILDASGHVLSSAGHSLLPQPDVNALRRMAPGPGLSTTLLTSDGEYRVASLKSGGWLVLTTSREPQRLALYERILQRGLLILLGFGMTWLVVNRQMRAVLSPLGRLSERLKEAPATEVAMPSRLQALWPEFAEGLERHWRRWRDQLQELEQSGAHAEDELRETLEAIERQNIVLHAARREAQEHSQLKSAFLANISHEIRTPLNSLLGFARLLAKTPLDKRQQEYVNALTHSGEHLLAILNDLLDLSRIEAGRLQLDETPLDPGILLHDTAEMLQPLLADKPVHLEVEVSADVPERLIGDPLRLRQIMTNLIGNAIKFTSRGEIRAVLDAGPLDAGRVQMRLRVSDTGIGMSKDVVDRLFEAFQQGDVSTSRRFGGSGLGLAITRQLVELMQGRIQVSSEPGRGSCFEVTWPASVDPFAPMLPSQPLLSSAADTGARLAVLIVDDHPANLQLLEAWLAQYGVDAVLADSGEAALEKCRERTFDLIFMDIQMPGLSGLETSQAIRELETRGVRTPIIALTAHALPSERELWLRSGIDDYLGKPLDESQLLHVLQQWTRFTPGARETAERSTLAGTLLEAFMDDLPQARASLASAVATDDTTAWLRAVHRLLGATRYCDMPRLQTVLESILARQAPDERPDPSLVADLKRALDDVSAGARTR